MPFEAGLSRGWFNKGVKAGRSGRYGDMYAAWAKAAGKPKTSGGRVTAQESFYQGYFDGHDARKKNPAGGKSVRLSNFTGTVKKNANGTISITGRSKPKRNPSKTSARRRVSRALTKYVRGQR